MRHDEGLKKDPLLKSRRKTAINFIFIWKRTETHRQFCCINWEKKAIVGKLGRRSEGKVKTERENLDISVMSRLICIGMGTMDETRGTHGGEEKYIQSFGCKI